MDLFEKFKGLEIVGIMKASGMYPFFRRIDGSRGNHVLYKNNNLVMMGSNNYLGLTHDPRVIEASVQAVKKWGTGCTGSRFLNGNLALHEELEAKLAEFVGTEDCAVYATGFMANLGAIGALVNEGDYIISDEENHACIIEGCRLTKADIKIYKHNDMADLEKKLKEIPIDAGKLIITDGVFSMTGHIANYPDVHALAKKYKARTYVDDAHGLGVVGKGGRGTCSHFGVNADIIMGTFSKSLASQGGYICGTKEMVEWQKIKAKSFMFSAALAPASTASALKALEVLIEEPHLVTQVQDNAKYLKKCFDEINLDTMGTETCVVPVMIGSDEMAIAVCQELLQKGVFTTVVPHPAVPKGQALIRCSVMATHTTEDLNMVVSAFKELAPMIFEGQKQVQKTDLWDNLENGEENTDTFDRIKEMGAQHSQPEI